MKDVDRDDEHGHPGGKLVRDLSRPAAYPGPRPEWVELRSTHISWVFLTDDTAYKVKRPVDLGFVDYSTLEKRRRACEDELRLNRRLAPDVYLAVVPICLGPDGHNIDGEGPVVDWAVKMRRLPDERSGAALLATQQLSHAALADLARRLAVFYREAPERPGHGGAAKMSANVEENLRQIVQFVGTGLAPKEFAAVSYAQCRAVDVHAPELDARRDQGRVRDGHGDLRLEHVYFPDRPGQAPLVIDTVEFADRFRCADVALDVAFLAMELEAAGRRDLGDYFLYRFARESNDYDFFPLLDFYLAYRAVVRCKVAALVAADPSTAPEKARRKWHEAARLLALANRHDDEHRASRPPAALIVVGGLVGSGKSTLAETIAREHGAVVVSSDATRKHLAGIPATEHGPPWLYDRAFTEQTYDELFRRAGCVLASGRRVVLDATFATRAQRDRARALAASHDVPFLFVEARCDEAALRARLRARAEAGASESDADELVLARTRASFQPPSELDPAQHFVADTARAPVELMQVLARVLAPELPAPASAATGLGV